MGNRVRRGAGQQIHFPNRQALAELQQLRRGHDVLARLPLAQEIDVEIGGDGQPDRANGREQHHVHGEIGQRHQGRPGDRSARPQHAFIVGLAQQAGLAIGAFDHDIPTAERLRKLPVKKLLELRHAHLRRGHIFQPCPSREAFASPCPIVYIRVPAMNTPVTFPRHRPRDRQ